DRLPAAARHQRLVDEPGPGVQGDHAVPRLRRDRGDRVHPGGPAADPDPVRQARDRAPDELRRADLPAVARQHRRPHPAALRILARLTFPGALYLAAVAALPTVLINQTSANFFFGGTSILIVIGVALDTMKQLEAQLMMRNYEGFLK